MGEALEVLYPRCCGLDVHKKTVVACALITPPHGPVEKHLQTFSTMTNGLLALLDWLNSLHVSHVAIESTGIFWRPIFNLLEGQHEVILVNAQHMKAVPGRKTDIKDSEWLASLLRQGLLAASFIPPKPIRDVRDLVRYRKSLVNQRTQEINRIQKVLETANIKLACVASDVVGVSGRAMLHALIEGITDAPALAELSRGTLRRKRPQLQEALQGRVDDHHRCLLKHMLAHIDWLESTLEHLQHQIEELLAPRQQTLDLLMSIPGIQLLSALTILSEIGEDMSRFPSASHLASWAGVCPGNKQSAGKRLSGKTTEGNPHLRAALVEIVWVITHLKDNYLSAQYHRFAKRLGKAKAVTAASHSVLVIIYHVLRDQKPYQDLGADYFDRLDTRRLANQSVKRLEALGFQVTLQPREEVSV